MSTEAITCYNKGCGKQYLLAENSEDACTFHPGVPVFHDALKGWSCCNKKSTDFSTFLSYTGCTKGQHSNIKPVEPEKVKPEKTDVPEIAVRQPIRPQEPTERPSELENLDDLQMTISPSLVNNLQNIKTTSLITYDSDGNPIIPPSTPCKNSGCQSTYVNEKSNLEKCLFHSGQPVFHEGMKYWSCCEKKTSEFDNFLSQAGCTEGLHTWIKENDTSEKITCRFDFHQTGNFAVLTVFSKNPVPNESSIKANRVKLDVNITFENGNKKFSRNYILYGVIDLNASSVTYYQTKVEIKLKKADPISWKRIEHY